MNDLLAALRTTSEFAIIMDELVKSRPVIPGYAVQPTRDDEARLLESIKFETGRRDGFDLLYRLLTGRNPS